MVKSPVIQHGLPLVLAILLVAGCAAPQAPFSPTATPLSCPTAPACISTSAAFQVEAKFPISTDITITFNPGNQCSLEGADIVYTGTTRRSLDYDLVVNDRSNEMYYVAISTLAEGKTLADLQAQPESEIEPPSFVNVLVVNFVHGGDALHTTLSITQGPLYVSCFIWSQGVSVRIADLGPIEVR